MNSSVTKYRRENHIKINVNIVDIYIAEYIFFPFNKKENNWEPFASKLKSQTKCF